MKNLSRFIIALSLIGGSVANAYEHGPGNISCITIIDKGWSHMPDVTDYVLAKPNSDKLGYGSPCHINSLVFAQCFIEPRWSVKKATDELINKAVNGQHMPDTPVCGA